MAKILFWTSVAIVVGAAVCSSNNINDILDPNEWWGPMELKENQDTSIRSFEVNFEPEMIENLKYRLRHHRRWIPPLEGAENFVRGFNTEEMEGWLSYWAEEYPFSEREAFFNQFPQYKTNIQGLDIHFIRVKPEVPAGVKVLPLLLLHGWPGSVREFYGAIPLLTQQTPGYDFVFEVIVPSLPGFGFSDAAVREGLGAPRMAAIMMNLMKRLGFEKYYLQGGDWGAVISSTMVTLYPDYILGHHSNMPSVRSNCSNPEDLDANSTTCGPTSILDYLKENFGYFHLQSTKPDSIGAALSDTPAGFLAYIVEDMGTWTNKDLEIRKDSGLLLRFTREQIIDNIMVYWTSNCITTSIRIYAENVSKKNTELGLDSIKSPVPVAMLQSKHEIFHASEELLKTKFPVLLRNTHLDQGGHFLAFELPEILVADVFESVKLFIEWHEKNDQTSDCSS